MPRNIEIKARIDSVDGLLPRARSLADGEPRLIEQDDSFFVVPQWPWTAPQTPFCLVADRWVTPCWGPDPVM